MKDFFKNNLATTIVVIATIILGGVAVFTAFRLYQLRQQPVAPNSPVSKPAAEENAPSSDCQLSFSLSTQTSTPTGSPTSTPTSSPTSTPADTSTPTPTSTPSGTSTPNPTPTPTLTSTPTDRPIGGGPTGTPATLPQAGNSFPAILGIGAGTFLILAGVLLVL